MGIVGSYLTIVNDTSNPWMCKIGPDEAAVKIASITIGVIGAAAAVIATAGAALPVVTIVAGVTGTTATVGGVSLGALATVSAAAAAASGVTGALSLASGFGIAVAGGITAQLSTQGYQKIGPGESHRYGKMSLSLWQQGTCTRAYIVDQRTVRTETVYMRPIFSGAFDNADNKHEIQYWINKFGTEKSNVVAKAAGGGRERRAFRGEKKEAASVYEESADDESFESESVDDDGESIDSSTDQI